MRLLCVRIKLPHHQNTPPLLAFVRVPLVFVVRGTLGARPSEKREDKTRQKTNAHENDACSVLLRKRRTIAARFGSRQITAFPRCEGAA